MGLLKHGKVPPPFPPHVAKHVGEGPTLYDLVKEQERDGAAGIVQAEKALGHLEHAYGGERPPSGPYGEGLVREAVPARRGADRMRTVAYYEVPRVALGEGARHVDAGARPDGGPRADRARGRHVLRCR